MAALRILRNRVASIRTIQRVTSALRLVAAARMRRQQALADAALPYSVQLERILAHVLAQDGL